MPEENPITKRKKSLKKLLLLSMLMEYDSYEKTCDLIDVMEEEQLDKAEVAFLNAFKKKEAVMNRLFEEHPNLPKQLGKLGEKWGKMSKVTRVTSLGRDVLKSTIKE